MAKGTCSVCGAEGNLKRGWCSIHYQRWWKHGDPLAAVRIFGDDRARFESRVDRSGGPDACHMFDGPPGSEGYCHFRVDGETRMAHAFAWELANGPLPADLETGRRYDVDHLCHNLAVKAGLCWPGVCLHRRCCNERHLQPKQPEIHSRGSSSGNAKLTEAQIPGIRAAIASGEAQQSIADRYGVSQILISLIKRDRAWAHVTG